HPRRTRAYHVRQLHRHDHRLGRRGARPWSRRIPLDLARSRVPPDGPNRPAEFQAVLPPPAARIHLSAPAGRLLCRHPARLRRPPPPNRISSLVWQTAIAILTALL